MASPLCIRLDGQGEGKGCIAAPAFGGSLAEATKVPSQHFRHADTNLAIPRTSAWFMNSRLDALLGDAAQLKQIGACYQTDCSRATPVAKLNELEQYLCEELHT
eukprot:1157228-Pelagomonas_calceolata.AAC.1